MKLFWRRNLEKKTKFLGELEGEIMQILWRKSPLSAREICEKLSRRRPLALTTVHTILHRLIRKGLVRKMMGEKVYLFQPTLTRDEWRTKVGRELILQALDLSPETVISTFADILTSLPSNEFLRFMDEIGKKRDEK